MNIIANRGVIVPASYETEVGYVYYLYNKGKIVYVGKSVSHPEGRARDHKRTGKDFDSLSWGKYRKEDIAGIEAHEIFLICPPMNKVFPHRSGTYLSLFECSRLLVEFNSGLILGPDLNQFTFSSIQERGIPYCDLKYSLAGIGVTKEPFLKNLKSISEQCQLAPLTLADRITG